MTDRPRAVLDACALFPTVLRRMLLGAAALGAFAPLWSPRILEEWARATRRRPDGAEAVARAEIARMRADWPDAEVEPGIELVERLHLPDADDRHVLAAAIAAQADTLVTLNLADFPGRILAGHGVFPRHPDPFLLELLGEGYALGQTAEAIRADAERTSGEPRQIRNLLKRAGLPRLGKALGT